MQARQINAYAAPTLAESEFALFQQWVFARAGITLGPAKKSLVSNRLQKRVAHHGCASFGEYFQLIASGTEATETQMALDLLTTNETYFFREPKHFEFLTDVVLPALRARKAELRIWSAACSSGEEPYSIAMMLAAHYADLPWEVFASDLSTRVLENAARGQFPMARTEHIPLPLLQRFCRKGIGRQEGTFRVEPTLRERITFGQVNLNEKLPEIGKFEVVFLRNVLIYFNAKTKQEVVRRLADTIPSGGYLFIGHSESLHGYDIPYAPVKPAIYRRL